MLASFLYKYSKQYDSRDTTISWKDVLECVSASSDKKRCLKICALDSIIWTINGTQIELKNNILDT